ncbi:MAG: nucleoside monophosphate kinase [Pseudomonadales bacterium]|jgi:adenylate kinase|nr:nucleoside monophosphate kinase [Pseudomonadales bacterium]
MKIVLIGIQGAGKSTQGTMLSEKLGVPYLSSGHIFRAIAREKNQQGRFIKEIMNSGKLIPDDVTLQVVLDYLHRDEYETGYILDGFPRTVAQAEVFNGDVEKVILLEVSDREALWRIADRNSDREDETLAAIKHRIKLFHEHTTPVIEYYDSLGKLARINGEQDVDAVFQDTLKALGKE